MTLSVTSGTVTITTDPAPASTRRPPRTRRRTDSCAWPISTVRHRVGGRGDWGEKKSVPRGGGTKTFEWGDK